MDRDVKRTGYILLGTGLVLIVGSLIQIAFVFTSTIQPIQMFSFLASDFALDGEVLFPQLPSNLTRGMQVEIFPAELINTVLNLGINTMFVVLLIFAGSKIASLGVQLLRPIYVKQKEQ